MHCFFLDVGSSDRSSLKSRLDFSESFLLIVDVSTKLCGTGAQVSSRCLRTGAILLDHREERVAMQLRTVGGEEPPPYAAELFPFSQHETLQPRRRILQTQAIGACSVFGDHPDERAAPRSRSSGTAMDGIGL